MTHKTQVQIILDKHASGLDDLMCERRFFFERGAPGVKADADMSQGSNGVGLGNTDRCYTMHYHHVEIARDDLTTLMSRGTCVGRLFSEIEGR